MIDTVSLVGQNISCTNTDGVGPGFANDYDYLINTFGHQKLNDASTFVVAETGPEGTAQTQTTTFTIPTAQTVVFDIDIDKYSTIDPYVKLEKSESGSWVQIFNITTSGTKFEDLAVSTTYRLTAYAGGQGTFNSDRAYIKANWYTTTGNYTFDGPGLRIKQISQKESASSLAVNIRKFEYTDANGDETGVLYAAPIHSYRKFIQDNSTSIIIPLIVQSSGSQFANYSAALGYSRVTEIRGQNGENGKVVDEYRVDPGKELNHLLFDLNFDYDPLDYPFAPSLGALWDMGQLLKSSVYRKKKPGESGADYKIVQETVNTYEYDKVGEVNGVAIAMVFPAITVGIGNSCYDEIPFTLTSIWERLVKTEQTIFSDAEIGQTTVTELTYETTPGHLQVKSQAIIGSDGRKTITEYTYPLDYDPNNLHPYISVLKDKEMHAAVIEELNILEYSGTREILGGKITKYNATSLQPEEIFTLKVGSTALLESSLYKSTSYSGGSSALKDSRYESRITFIYNDGNLVQQTPASGNPMTYIWGYDGQYPVAQVQNATFAQVEGLSAFGSNFTLGNGGLNGTGTQETALRGLKGALVTTMTFTIGEGMKSQTTPNGLITKYEYDDFQRLRYVKDQDDNILRRMDYEYKVNANTTNN